MKFNPVLYDFKRGLLRLSVILVLILFTASGIGLAYLVSISLAVSPGAFSHHIIIMTADTETKTLKIEGYVHDGSLRDINGVFNYNVYCYNTSKIYEELSKEQVDYQKIIEETKIILAQGSVGFRGKFSNSTELRLNESEISWLKSWYTCQSDITLSTPYGYVSKTIVMRAYQFEEKIILQGLVGDFVGYSKVQKTIEASGNQFQPYLEHGELGVELPYKRNSRVVIVGAIGIPEDPYVKLDVYVRERTSPESGRISLEDLERQGFYKISTVSQDIFIIELNLINQTNYGLDILLLGESSDGYKYYAWVTVPIFESPSTDPRTMSVVNVLLGGAALGLFSMFFPVVMLYLAYVYIAKPRSQGALEFVIARPINRFDLYITRYLSGVLVALVASTVFYVALTTSIWILLEVSLELYVHLLISASIALSLVAFYGLCYFLSTFTRGTRYLALAIFIYIFFAIIMPIVISIIQVFLFMRGGGLVSNPQKVYEEMTKMQYLTRYFTPFGIQDFAEYYVMKHYNITQFGLDFRVIETVVQPWAVVLSSLAWLAVPVITGWYVFKKANLAS